VVRHAKATKLEVTLAQTSSGRVLTVRANGVGFHPSLHKKKSFGLLSIREWVLTLGDGFKLTSAHGQGNVIEVEIPIALSSSTPAY